MGFDPMTMLMLATTFAGLTGVGGNDAKQGSTYSRGARSAIDDVLDSIKGMKGGATDITQNPEFMTGQKWLQDMFNDPEFFKSFEAPLRRDFEENITPSLANRFASMGSGGSLGSTSFRNALGREGSNLETNIAALRGGMQQNAIPQLQSYAQNPFQNLMQLYGIGTQPTMNQYQPAHPGPFAGAANATIQGFAGGWANQQGQRFAGQSPSTM